MPHFNEIKLLIQKIARKFFKSDYWMNLKESLGWSCIIVSCTRLLIRIQTHGASVSNWSICFQSLETFRGFPVKWRFRDPAFKKYFWSPLSLFTGPVFVSGFALLCFSKNRIPLPSLRSLMPSAYSFLLEKVKDLESKSCVYVSLRINITV